MVFNNSITSSYLFVITKSYSISAMKLSNRVKLCREALGLSQERVAELIGVSQPSYARIEKGEVSNPKHLDKLAEIYQTTPQWIKYGSGNSPKYLNLPSIPDGKIPIIPWNLINKWHRNYDISSLLNTTQQSNSYQRVAENGTAYITQQIDFISIPNRSNSKQFAIRVIGDAMVSPSPGKKSFLDGDIIIIDPEKSPERDNFVIALQKGSNEALFKQLVIDGNTRYLRPLNPQYPMIKLDDSIEICGVIVAHLDVLL